MPLLSIIIPVYKAEKTISITIRSLHVISFESKKYVEVVIVNDGTPDASMSIVRALVPDLAPMQVVIVDQRNKGLAGARNAGLSICKGSHVFFLDADDELALDPIPNILDHPDASAIAFSVSYYRNGSQQRTRRPVPITPLNHMDVFSLSNTLSSSSIIFRKNRISVAFDESFRCLEDWLFWMMNPGIFEKLVIIPNIQSAFIHIHGENMTSDYRTMGIYRQKAVELVTAVYGAKLTMKQRNNLHIQAAIGAVFQGEYPSVRTFFRFPCNVRLLAKLLIYTVLTVLKKDPARISIYRK
ncbi:MAG: glycosyltransferase family 2 protein [Smithellaceae bacterium]